MDNPWSPDVSYVVSPFEVVTEEIGTVAPLETVSGFAIAILYVPSPTPANEATFCEPMVCVEAV